jgi:T5orf172 domain
MKTTLYVITNISMPSLCKVGVTDDLGRRLNDLNKTGVPTRFQVYESFELENAELLEQEVLKHFANKRLNRKREFIEEHPERVCDFIRENKNKGQRKKVRASLRRLVFLLEQSSCLLMVIYTKTYRP